MNERGRRQVAGRIFFKSKNPSEDGLSVWGLGAREAGSSEFKRQREGRRPGKVSGDDTAKKYGRSSLFP